MAHVNGRLRPLTTRLSSERVPRVKYSTLCPSRKDSPSAAIRAMPTSFWRESVSRNSGREATVDIRYLFAHNDSSQTQPCQIRISASPLWSHDEGYAADVFPNRYLNGNPRPPETTRRERTRCTLYPRVHSNERFQTYRRQGTLPLWRCGFPSSLKHPAKQPFAESLSSYENPALQPRQRRN